MKHDERVNILVVDDMPERLLVYQAILEELGENVLVASSGAEALRRVLAQDFAVIILDVNMPGLDGFETAALIHKRKKSAHVPIIFVTAYADEIHAAQGYAQGAVDFILTPVRPDILRTKVRVFVDLFRMNQQIRRQADERVVLAEEQAKRQAAEHASRRFAFLSEASRALMGSLELADLLRELVGFAVPALADASAVVTLGAHGSIGHCAYADAGVRPGEALSFAAGSSELHPEVARWLQEAMQSGEAQRNRPLEPASPLITASCSAERQSAAVAVPIRWLTVFPLAARGRVLGAVALGRSAGPQDFTADDLVLAEELAFRGACALDNVSLCQSLREADRRKDEFLAMLAHELRNPLAPIRNAVDLLSVVPVEQPELGWVRDLIGRQVEQLIRLVDDLLDVSRITRGKIQLRLQPVALDTIVAHAVETSRPAIEARRHTLTVSLPSPQIWLNADSARLAQTLSNLLNNAAKYTEEAGRIAISAERCGNDAVIRVRDNGVGIPPEMLSSVFDMFTQVDRSLDRSQGGLGIGLTLVRRLVELHGGRVTALSDGLRQGTEMVIQLPMLVTARLEQSRGPAGDQRAAAAQPFRVLVVDDNCDAASALALLLRYAGHDVHLAHDGPAALAVMPKLQPHVVLLDIGLPRMDGYEVARQIRSQGSATQPVLIAVTGYGQEEDQRRSREAGFNFHLVKPVDLTVLTEALASIIAQADCETPTLLASAPA